MFNCARSLKTKYWYVFHGVIIRSFFKVPPWNIQIILKHTITTLSAIYPSKASLALNFLKVKTQYHKGHIFSAWESRRENELLNQAYDYCFDQVYALCCIADFIRKLPQTCILINRYFNYFIVWLVWLLFSLSPCVLIQ